MRNQHFFRSPNFIGRYVIFISLSIVSISSSFAQNNRATLPEAGTKNAAKANASSATAASRLSAAKSALSNTTLLPGDRCTGDPKFLEKIGFSKRALVDTTSTHRVGLLVTDVQQDGRPGRSTQHETWTQGGFLGRVQRDKEGNIYTYPAPNVTLAENPVEKANIVYRVESETGVMAPFVELPKAAPATEQNPFGLLALALDCEQNALYAASVYGSTASTENGVIAKIDLATKAVTIVKKNIDALSLLVAFDGRGKRLYVGTARDNAVVSYSFNKDGSLAGDESIEIKLDEIQVAQDKRPRVLRVDGRGRMYVRAIPFEYNLAARTTIPTTEMNFALQPNGAEKLSDKKNANATRFTLLEQKTTEVPALRPQHLPSAQKDSAQNEGEAPSKNNDTKTPTSSQ
jgi:hypothetical protein